MRLRDTFDNAVTRGMSARHSVHQRQRHEPRCALPSNLETTPDLDDEAGCVRIYEFEGCDTGCDPQI